MAAAKKKMPAWLISLISTVVGAVIGVFLEPAKAWVSHWPELNGGRREIYSELGAYIAEMERIQSGSANFAQAERSVTKRPKFESFAWYMANRFDLLLRLDKGRGIRGLHASLVSLYEEASAKSGSSFDLPAKILKSVEINGKYLDAKLLRRSIDAAKKKNYGDHA